MRRERTELYVSRSATASPAASRTSVVTVRRRRSLTVDHRPRTDGATDRSRARQPEGVADAPDRVDQRRVELVDLLAQVADVGLDDVRVPVEGVVPDPVEDLGLGHDPPPVLEQVP